MPLKLYNSLTKTIDQFTPLDETVRLYSCGPTVYDHVHIGNLSAFIFADTLRRVLSANGFNAKHVMNFTDVDDKTIQRSREEHPNEELLTALQLTTQHYSELFLSDMTAVGNDIDAIDFIRATDSSVIAGMQDHIRSLVSQGFAYAAEDGIYFSIDAYKKSGKVYGQLVDVSVDSTSQARIKNDEYDKESAHDFALWKIKQAGEPAWEFNVNGQDFSGRPGWHIECSVMSKLGLGQPFDIHTGGIDLMFPHHENEIAQSTAGQDSTVYAQFFTHNEHILVDGKKMSKSLGNFYTLDDLKKKSIDPLAFRLLVLQSHYRRSSNFSLEAIESATNRLRHWRELACLRWQVHDTLRDDDEKDTAHDVNGIILAAPHAALEALNNDLNMPAALAVIETAFDAVEAVALDKIQYHALSQFLEWLDEVFGLQLLASTPDISEEHKRLILERTRARDQKNWERSDDIRHQLAEEGVELRDLNGRTVWTR